MAPSNLQGLNIVHPAPPQNPYVSDQDLLSIPPFPDLSAQLDLWTNLNFQSDEPLISSKDRLAEKRRGSNVSEEDLDKYNLPEDENTGKIAEAGSHENVVTGTVIPPAPVQTPVTGALSHLPPFDLGSLLAGFGLDPFQVPGALQMPPTAAAPSLAQLLSYHSAGLRPLQIPGDASASQQSSTQAAATSQLSASMQSSYPAQKRARTSRSTGPADLASPSEAASPISPEADEKPSETPASAGEDKRRRNTAASARFRLKKKEREAALEKKAKELEVRVSELEKECEALRRENGWLKGLVVGVTGAGAVQQQQVTAGSKRGREEEAQGFSSGQQA